MFDWIWASDLLVWFAAIILVSAYLGRRFSPTAGVAFALTSLSGLLGFQSTLNLLPQDPVMRLFSMTAESALLSLTLTTSAILALPTQSWKRAFKWIAVLNALAIIAMRLAHPHETPWGVLLNGSMSGCFSAVLYPLFDRRERWQRTLVAVSVFAIARSLPVGVFACVIGSILFLNRKFRIAALAIPITLVLGFVMKGKSFLDSDGRFHVWNLSFRYFLDHIQIWKGAGLGSYYVLGQALTYGQFIWMHSDWLQLGFELGVVGLISIVIMYGEALWRARQRADVFAALAGFGAFGIANMPLRYPLAGLYGAFLVRWALERARPAGAIGQSGEMR